jgi:hypothetical protein
MPTAEMAKIEKRMNDALKLEALTYIYFARPTFEELGRKGETSIRNGLREFGRFRGKAIKDWHTMERLPLNVESLLRYWDTGAAQMAGIYDSTAVFTPYYVEHPVKSCVLHEVFKEEDWEQYGYVFCDEIHAEICGAYNPNAIVQIHENLNKGDPRCFFKWMMIPEGRVSKSVYDHVNQLIRENPENYALDSLKRTTRVVGALYYFLADSLIKDFGEKGKELVTNSLRNLGRRRGEKIKANLKREGKENTVGTVFGNCDLPYDILWKTKTIPSNEGSIIEVFQCPFAEVWHELGKPKIGLMYCTAAYNALFEPLMQDVCVKVERCMMQGATKCSLSFKRN